jgi:hypothetical protein
LPNQTYKTQPHGDKQNNPPLFWVAVLFYFKNIGNFEGRRLGVSPSLPNELQLYPNFIGVGFAYKVYFDF